MPIVIGFIPAETKAYIEKLETRHNLLTEYFIMAERLENEPANTITKEETEHFLEVRDAIHGMHN